MTFGAADACLGLLLATALATEFWRRKFFNLPFVVFLAAGLVAAAFEGRSALGWHLAAATAALVVTYPLFAFGAIGGGDAKLAVCIGAAKGLPFLWPALAGTAAAGGVLALALALFRGEGRSTFRRFATAAVFLVSFRRLPPEEGAIRVPLAPAFALGCATAYFF